MPTYTYKCSQCGTKCDVVKKLAELERLEPCGSCETLEPMQRQVCAPRVAVDYAGYNCPITGDWIEGRRAHQENLKKHGCRVYEPGETEDFRRRKADSEADFDRRVGETVDEWIATAPAEKREALAIAEQQGITAEVCRPEVTL